MRAANDFAAEPVFHWRFLTPADVTVTSSSGLQVLSQGAAEACDACDFLFILASYGHLCHDTPETHRLLRQITHKAKTIVGFDTAPWLMAAAGLLDGRQATLHYDVFDAFAERFFQVEARCQPIVRDGAFYSCAGAHSAYDLTRLLIAEELGKAAAVDIDNLFVRNQSGINLGTRLQGVATSVVRRAIAEMRDNLETPLSLSEISAVVACSPKTLSRRFQAELGSSPGRVYRHLRLTHAHQLLENTRLSISEIGLRTGYNNPAALSRAFKAIRKEFSDEQNTT
jgi:transcriptional regulator GlxA family with amidase domain